MTRPLALVRFDGAQRARQRSGADTEQLVRALNEQCRVARVAVLRKRPTETRRGRDGVRCVAEAGVDFHGHLCGSGVAVYCEVKRCTSARWPFASLRPSQVKELHAAWLDGAVCAVLVVYGPTLAGAEVCAVPYGVVYSMGVGGAKSMRPEELRTWCVDRRTPWLSAPWLKPGVVLPGVT